jgi:hypothetical protein
MAGTVRHAKLESPTARAKLKRGRQSHWQTLITGRAHLGYPTANFFFHCRAIKKDLKGMEKIES